MPWAGWAELPDGRVLAYDAAMMRLARRLWFCWCCLLTDPRYVADWEREKLKPAEPWSGSVGGEIRYRNNLL